MESAASDFKQRYLVFCVGRSERERMFEKVFKSMRIVPVVIDELTNDNFFSTYCTGYFNDTNMIFSSDPKSVFWCRLYGWSVLMLPDTRIDCSVENDWLIANGQKVLRLDWDYNKAAVLSLMTADHILDDKTIAGLSMSSHFPAYGPATFDDDQNFANAVHSLVIRIKKVHPFVIGLGDLNENVEFYLRHGVTAEAINKEVLGYVSLYNYRKLIPTGKRKRLYVVAASGSGKSSYSKEHSDQYLDQDVLIADRKGWPDEPGWWELPDKLREVNAQNRRWMYEFLEVEDDKIILGSDATTTPDLVVALKPEEYAKRLRSRGNPWQPDYEYLQAGISKTAALSQIFPSVSDFDEIEDYFAADAERVALQVSMIDGQMWRVAVVGNLCSDAIVVRNGHIICAGTGPYSLSQEIMDGMLSKFWGLDRKERMFGFYTHFMAAQRYDNISGVQCYAMFATQQFKDLNALIKRNDLLMFNVLITKDSVRDKYKNDYTVDIQALKTKDYYYMTSDRFFFLMSLLFGKPSLGFNPFSKPVVQWGWFVKKSIFGTLPMTGQTRFSSDTFKIKVLAVRLREIHSYTSYTVYRRRKDATFLLLSRAKRNESFAMCPRSIIDRLRGVTSVTFMLASTEITAILHYGGRDMFISVSGHLMNMMLGATLGWLDLDNYLDQLTINVVEKVKRVKTTVEVAQKNGYGAELIKSGRIAQNELWHSIYDYAFAVVAYDLTCRASSIEVNESVIKKVWATLVSLSKYKEFWEYPSRYKRTYDEEVKELVSYTHVFD